MTPESIGIEVKDLKKKLGPNQALDSVSIRFEAGLMHGLIGPEGAGKTTLLRTLLQLLKPDTGSVSYSLNNSSVEYQEISSGVAYMPQQQSLYADLSVEEHLQFFRDLYSIPLDEYASKTENLLHLTRLKEFITRPAGKLSGGMYKKLGLMCALLRSPRVLFLDEPTNGVDPISRREFWDLLHGLSEQNILIIISTAYLDEAERCARAHLMESGKLIASGVPQELLRQEGVKNFDELFIRSFS